MSKRRKSTYRDYALKDLYKEWGELCETHQYWDGYDWQFDVPIDKYLPFLSDFSRMSEEEYRKKETMFFYNDDDAHKHLYRKMDKHLHKGKRRYHDGYEVKYR